MAPLSFSCEVLLPHSPREVAERVLNVEHWSDFDGYGPLPGIERAEFTVRTPDVVGSRIEVTNEDGSSHVEEVVEWQPARRVSLQLKEFSPPLAYLTDRFDETWTFEERGDVTRVTRILALHPASAWTRPALWLVARLFERAVARHLEQMVGGRAG